MRKQAASSRTGNPVPRLPTESPAPVTGSAGFSATLGLTILVGVFLRLYLLPGQILLDDEWHSMNFAAGVNSLPSLLVHFSLPGATCIPLNVYDYMLLKTTGWNEMLLRLPALAGGILALAILPLWVGRIFNRRTTVVFTCLLAISPMLVFYSRFVRPYSIVAFLGFAAILAVYSWATSGERKYAVIYAAASVVAVYFHLFAAVAVSASLGCIFLARLRDRPNGRKKRQPRVVPSAKALIAAAAVIAALSSLLVLPGLLTSRFPVLIAKDRMTVASLVGFTSMLSGTAEPAMTTAFCGLVAFGLIVLLKRAPLLGRVFLVTAILYFAMTWLSSPASIHAPIVISRYVIVLFPMSFVAAALGLDVALTKLETLKPAGDMRRAALATNLGAAGFLVLLFVTGPLPRTYARPNNFTNHSAFQESYRTPNWAQSYTAEVQNQYFSTSREDMPRFYEQLAKGPARAIIEYPMSFVNQFNLYYYYQHFHRKRVLIGYLARIDLSKNRYMLWVDESLSLVRDGGKLRFANMVNLADIAAIERSGAQYVVLHRSLLPGEWTPHNFVYPPQDYSEIVTFLTNNYIRVFGGPVFQDRSVVVFSVPGLTARSPTR